MSRRFSVPAMVFLVSVFLCVAAYAIEEGRSKRPLDLPAGGGTTESEESAPEVIHFYGLSYEGDGFFFLLDKSGSMGEFGKMDDLKREMAKTISSLSEQAQFGAVAFSHNLVPYSLQPLTATAIRKANFRAWVENLHPIGSTHMLEGAGMLIGITSISNLPPHRKVVIVVGDGLPNIPGPEATLSGILNMNWERLPFNTVLFDETPTAIAFMQELAQKTGGTFTPNPL